jgi:endonuclease III-like uncharacterized protein
MKQAKKTVAFRLEAELLKLLTAKAKELEISPGAYARILVTEALLGDSDLLEELREVAERQLRHEQHLRTATVALLVDAGKASVEDAEAFVRDNLS